MTPRKSIREMRMPVFLVRKGGTKRMFQKKHIRHGKETHHEHISHHEPKQHPVSEDKVETYHLFKCIIKVPGGQILKNFI